ncbi:MAG TPA: hypothetical protein VMS17_18250 [Gemmataceae bacterium]|nr:hypothetical protein [Gemmataceae bacterium]
MFGAWLASTLLILATGNCRWHDGSPWLIDAAEDDVVMMLGQPTDTLTTSHGGTSWYYSQTDWLGGRRLREIRFWHGIADKDRARYQPFAETPPWLEAVRSIIAPDGT